MTNFIDNRDGNTMAQALRQVFGDVEITGLQDGGDNSDYAEITSPEEVRIASAYFSPSGFQHIAKSIEKVGKLRLMLGADLPIEAHFKPRKPGQTAEGQHKEMLTQRLHVLQKGLETERNYLPFNAVTAQSMRALIAALNSGNMEVRQYKKSFLHAKAYIYTQGTDAGFGRNGILAGSSNLTSAGLTRNLELNIGRTDQPTVEKAIAWFDELWQDAEELDLADLYAEVFEPQSPWLVFLRVLHQLYDKELEADELTTGGEIDLTTFQRHGAARAMRLIAQNGGAIVADEVGLGKTFIAGEIIKNYLLRGQRTLLVCPAALRDSTWKDFLTKYQVFCECHSYHQLANDRQLNSNGLYEILERSKDEYQLIIVDEAHNYRNSNTPTRADVLRNLLGGRRKEVLMLTATPVNNSLWDLNTLIGYFIRQDAKFAGIGVPSIYQRFKDAARQDPSDLNPDVLYPIIDATTVKRTRQFVKKHYTDDEIKFGGKWQKIKFPEPKPITIRYDLEEGAPGLMEKVFDALDPDEGSLVFARYGIGRYQIKPDDDEEVNASSNAAEGLLRAGLLKRFESSSKAFGVTLERIRSQYEHCIKALEEGWVLTSDFHAEISADDEAGLEELLAESTNKMATDLFNRQKLETDLGNDLCVLNELIESTSAITPEKDPKLAALRAELEAIVKEAATEASDPETESNKRKVLIFSFFADTANWIYEWLQNEVKTNPKLAVLEGRIGKVAGADAQADDEEIARDKVVKGFAPVSMNSVSGENAYDILVATDVLAEGVNLQQCRHIVNYDLPWNPMRLVQRHGRIDRIGSEHNRVFLRSIFPDKQLDGLLKLEERILNKIKLAAATVGVQHPVSDGERDSTVFTETRQELERILMEDATFYEHGGSISAAQSGEEYRQTLRKALETQEADIVNLPWRAASGIKKGRERGIFFSAYIGEEPQLCFVRADKNWHPMGGEGAIEKEIGTCLRLIEVEEDEELHIPIGEKDAYPFWDLAVTHFYDQWQLRTDPKYLQPKLRRTNRLVIDFLETNKTDKVPESQCQEALQILKGRWLNRDAIMLKRRFEDTDTPTNEKVKALVDWIVNDSGIQAVEVPRALSPIQKEDIRLLCWMVVEEAEGEG